MQCTLEQVLSVVGAHVSRRVGVPPEHVRGSTPLWEEGLLDSFHLVELITELEARLGSRIPDGALLPEDFETPERLFRRMQKL